MSEFAKSNDAAASNTLRIEMCSICGGQKPNPYVIAAHENACTCEAAEDLKQRIMATGRDLLHVPVRAKLNRLGVAIATAKENSDQRIRWLVLANQHLINSGNRALSELDKYAHPFNRAHSAAASLREAILEAVGSCEITGNMCGTDTWAEGHPCTCGPCTDYVDRAALLQSAGRTE